MTIEQRLDILEKDVKYLRDTLMQAMANMTPVINKADSTSNKTDSLTPTILTKQAYIDDAEVVFNNVPNGNITVYVEDENGSFLNYSISRVTDMITVSFDRPLEYTATITLSIL